MDKKTCSECGLEKLRCDFSKNKTKKDGLNYTCKDCQKKYCKIHYKNNTPYYKNKSDIRRKETVEWHKKYKSKLVCEVCGEGHISCIEFHHLDPSKKESDLSRAVNNGWSLQKLEAEIKKCKVVCSNCHRKIHYNERSGLFKHTPDETEK